MTKPMSEESTGRSSDMGLFEGHRDPRYEEALKNVESLNTPAALFQLRRLAEEGSVPAMVNLAYTYEVGGPDVEPDYSEAVNWYRCAAKLGSCHAYAGLGRAYYVGRGVEQDLEAAFHWYSAIKGQDFPIAEQALGMMYFWGGFLERDLVEAERLFSIAAAKGYIHAAQYLGRIRIARGEPIRGWMQIILAKLRGVRLALRDISDPRLQWL